MMSMERRYAQKILLTLLLNVLNIIPFKRLIFQHHIIVFFTSRVCRTDSHWYLNQHTAPIRGQGEGHTGGDKRPRLRIRS